MRRKFIPAPSPSSSPSSPRRKKTILGRLPPVLPHTKRRKGSKDDDDSSNPSIYKEQLDIYMSGLGVEKIFFRSGTLEVRISIDMYKNVKAAHNILGWWETISNTFLITVVSDEYSSIRKLVLENPRDPRNKIIMDNPSVVRISWEDEPTIG